MLARGRPVALHEHLAGGTGDLRQQCHQEGSVGLSVLDVHQGDEVEQPRLVLADELLLLADGGVNGVVKDALEFVDAGWVDAPEDDDAVLLVRAEDVAGACVVDELL